MADLTPTNPDQNNPFASWMANPSAATAPAPNPLGNTQIGATAPSGGSFGDPTGQSGWSSDPNTIAKNIGVINEQTGQMRNTLIPAFAQNMFSAGGPAMGFYKSLMDPNSPFARYMQRATWEQGVKQSSDAGAQERQQVRASGYGYTPSGVEAAMMGDQSRAMSSTLIGNFLQNLFSMPEAGAQGLTQLMQLFNPSQLTGQSTPTGDMQQTPTTMQNLEQMLGAIFGTGGVGGIKGVKV